MSTINDSDLLAIERSGTLYQIRRDEMSTLNNTDLLVVERSGTLYKVAAEDINTGSIATPVKVLTPLNGSGLQEGQSYEPLSAAITAVDNTGGNFTATTSGFVYQGSQPTYHDHADYSYSNSSLTTLFNAAQARAFLAGTSTITASPFYLALPDYLNNYRSNLGSNQLNRAEFHCTSGVKYGLVDYSGGSYSVYTKAIAGSGSYTLEWSGNSVGFWISNYGGTLTFNGLFRNGQGARYFFANGVYQAGNNAVLYMTDNSGFSNISAGDTLNISSGGTIDVEAIDGTATPYPTITVASGTYAVGTTFSRTYDTYDSQITFADTTNLADIIPTAKEANSDGTDYNNATIGSIKELSGSVMKVSNISNGPLTVGKYIKGAQITGYATAAGSVVFTSENSGTSAMTTTDATVATRVWRLETASSASGPWTLVNEYTDTSAVSSQDGATAWAGRPTLSANTYYRVRVTYTSTNANQQVSDYNIFKTAA